MKIVKILAVLVLIYVGIVVLFESLLGYFQPQNESTLVITITDDNGDKSSRVLAHLQSQDKMYVAVNHWPRQWYYDTLEHPRVSITVDGSTGDYEAVPVYKEDAEYDQVSADNPLGIGFRILTGFPPRYFFRLDPI